MIPQPMFAGFVAVRLVDDLYVVPMHRDIHRIYVNATSTLLNTLIESYQDLLWIRFNALRMNRFLLNVAIFSLQMTLLP